MRHGRKLLAGALAAVMAVYAGAGSGLGVIAENGGLTGVMQVLTKAQFTAPNSTGNYNGLSYHTYDDHVEIANCSDETITSVEIPAEIEGLPVTVILDAFSYCTNLTEVTIPDTVTIIGENAFRECSSLTAITIPDGVTAIGNSAFYQCSNLTEVNIPDGVTTIGNYAFGSTALTEIVIPDSVTSIGQSAFHSCQNLTDVTLSKGLTSIKMSTFSNCGITAVNIPDGVASIEKWAFSSCSSLTEVSIPDSVTTIETQAFYDCDSLTRVVIPASVTNYSEYAFSGCDNLTEIVFGEQPATEETTEPTETTQMSETTQTTVQTTVQTTETAEPIGDLLYVVFNDHAEITGCADTAITSATIPRIIDGVPVTMIGKDAFRDCSLLKTLIIPDSVTSIGNYAFAGTALTEVVIPDSVTSIGQSAFHSCQNLTDVTLSKGLTSIKMSTFGNCGITAVTIPEGVTSIEKWAFSNCASLMEVSIPDSVTTIETQAFYDCDSLTRVVIPTSVTNYSEYAFSGCDNLMEIVFGEQPATEETTEPAETTQMSETTQTTVQTTVQTTETQETTTESVYVGAEVSSEEVPEYLSYWEYLGTITITGCEETVTTISIPAKIDGIPVTRIDHYAFENCTNLTHVDIPDTVTSIGGSAFANSGLTSVRIPDSVTNIYGSAFANCKTLTRVTLSCNLSSEWVGVFSGCTALSEVVVPEGVSIIGNEMFKNCINLNKVQLPSSIRSIGANAFEGCTSLTEIELPEGLESIGQKAFYGCEGLTRVFLPTTLTGLGTSAFQKTDAEVLVKKSEYLAEPLRETGRNCSLIMVSHPWKTDYQNGESLDLAGMQVDAIHNIIYNDKIICSSRMSGLSYTALTVSGFDNKAEGEQTVTLLYEYYDFTASVLFTVTVAPISIQYDANGGTSAPAAQTKKKGETLVLSSDIPVMAGYQFAGWSTTADGEVEYNAGGVYEKDANLTLYAVWDYCITYNANGGTGAPETQTVRQEEYHPYLSDIVPTREGYSFGGWALRPNGSAVYEEGDYYYGNVSVTLYAVWNQYCQTCGGSGKQHKDCPTCTNGKIISTHSCSNCSGTGIVTTYKWTTCLNCDGMGYNYVGFPVFTDCIFCYGDGCMICDYTGLAVVEGEYEYKMVKCVICNGNTVVENSTTGSCANCGGDGKTSTTASCGNCYMTGYLTSTCSSCGGVGELFSTATSTEETIYCYTLTAHEPQFYLAHDTTPLQKEDLIASVTRYTFNSITRTYGTPELLTDWSTLTLKGTTPAEQFSGQSGLHDLVFECTDKYGAIELPAAASAYIGVKGDANMDGTADAADAAAILVYAAECGASGSAVLYSDTDETMERFAYFLADIDGESTDGGIDSPLDAEDAAAILVYAAAQGSGSNMTWEELLGTT